MLRVYCSDWDGGEILPDLDGDEVHHLVRVRRARPGEDVEVLNGRGHIGRARVVSVGNRALELGLESTRFVEAAALQIRLCVALPKGKTFSTLLQKVVELGVSRVTPLITENVEAVAKRADSKQGRWQAVLVEALKQSGNPYLPVLDEPRSLNAVFEDLTGSQCLCAALQPDAQPLWEVMTESLRTEGNLAVFIGPEGDFSPDEYAQLREAGCHFATLGPLVLKVETAASLVAGVLQVWAQGTGRV